jgi:hypothetical protein
LARRLAIVTGVLIVIALRPSHAAHAQVEVSPIGGLYVPTASVADNISQSGTFPTGRAWKHETAAAVGGRLTIWLSQRLALDGSIIYAPSDIQMRTPVGSFTQLSEIESELLIASARAVWRLGAPSQPVTYRLAGGLGLVHRSGERYESTGGTEFHGTTDPALVLGGGLRAKLANHLKLGVEIEDYAYFTHFTFLGPLIGYQDGTTSRSETDWGRQFQSDLVMSVALVVQL